MKPSDLSEELRRIASAIDNSKSPSRELVLKDLNQVIRRVGADQVMVDSTLKSMKKSYDRMKGTFGSISDLVQEAIHQIENRDPSTINEYYPGWTDEQLEQALELMRKYL